MLLPHASIAASSPVKQVAPNMHAWSLLVSSTSERPWDLRLKAQLKHVLRTENLQASTMLNMLLHPALGLRLCNLSAGQYRGSEGFSRWPAVI